MDTSISDDKNQPKVDGGSENIFDIDAATDVGSMDTEAYINHMNVGPTVIKCLVDALAYDRVFPSQGTVEDASSTTKPNVPPQDATPGSSGISASETAASQSTPPGNGMDSLPPGSTPVVATNA